MPMSNKAYYRLLGVTDGWIESVGGLKKASDSIQLALECSRSKSDKIAGRRYPSKLVSLEERALKFLTSVGAEEGFRAS